MEQYNTFDEERQKLLYHETKKMNGNGTCAKMAVLLSACMVLTSFIFIVKRTDSTIYESTMLDSTIYEIQVAANNPDYGVLNTDNLPWTMVLEPYRSQNLYISSLTEDDRAMEIDSSSYSATWTIAGQEYIGLTPTIMLNHTGVYDGNVALKHRTKTYELDFTVAVKYVRREIRTLTDADREAFFDALETMYDTDDVTGKSLYGDKYASAEYFSYKHLTGAGTTDCDHWHDGAGFPTIHTAFTLFAEQALQSIDPAIAMPYWEYAQVIC